MTEHDAEPPQQTPLERETPVEIPIHDRDDDARGSFEKAPKLPESERERDWWSWWSAHGEGPLTRLLRDEWNPIGFDDVRADEYASYATRLGGLLREGVSADQIATFLDDTRTGALGLPSHPDEDRRVAQRVHDWYANARRAT
jgi:hypothetical protein